MRVRSALVAVVVAIMAAAAATTNAGAATANAVAPVTSSAQYTGVSSRINSPDSRHEFGKHPQLHLVSVMANWKDVEPANGTFNWTSLQPSIDDARSRGYRVILRIMCGAQAPGWLYTDPSNPVSRIDLIASDGGVTPRPITAPLPWDPDLLVHYRAMLSSLQTWLSGSDGAGSTRASHVYFVPVAMPTEMGTEMPISYGKGSYIGVYKGASATWNIPAVNRAEWFSHALGGTTDAQKLASTRASMETAWINAIDAQMAVLTSVRSAIAFGGVFGDGYGAAKRIATLEVGKYPTRLYAMTTNLRPKIYVDGTLGPYRAWDPNAHQAMMNAIHAGGQVGFQTARWQLLDTNAKFEYAVNDAISTYGIRFLETAPYQVYLEQSYLLTRTANVQLRLQTLAGG